MADDVSVRFGGETDGLTRATNNAMRPIADFSDRVKDLNAQLAALDAPVRNVSSSAANATSSMDKLSFATAGATREFIVIGHEVMTGNYSRIPGSMLVLAERAGGLSEILSGISVATYAWVAAIAAATFATYEWATASERLEETQEGVRGALELNNQGLSYNAQAVEDNITRLRVLADVSEKTAEEIAVAFARASGLSVDLKQRLLEMVGDYAAATGRDAPKAADDLIKMFRDPERGAKQLADTFSGILTPAQLDAINTFARNGDTMKAQEALYESLGGRIDNFRTEHLTPLQSALEGLHNSWLLAFSTEELGNPLNLKGGTKQDFSIGERAEQQEQQNELIQAEMKGLEVAKTVHVEQSKINDLLDKRAALINAANAAMERGDDGLAGKFQQSASDVTGQIDRERALEAKRANAARLAEEKAALKESEQLAREEVSFEQQMGRLSIANRKAALDEQVSIGSISKKQEYEQLQKLLDDEYALENAALVRESQIDGLTAVQQQKVDDQMLVLHQRYLNQKEALTRKSTQDEMRQYDQVFQGINRAFTTSINGILLGTQTWQQATANIFTGILSVFVDMAEKMVAKWLESMVMNAIFGKEEAITTIATDAAQAGAGAYAATAAIPIVGPELAPAAAATAYGNTMAFQGLASFDVGAWNLPSDQVARVHQGEMIIPKPFADSMRENGGLGGGDTYHIHAVDAQSFVKMLKNNSAAITSIVGTGMRNFNSNLKPA